MNRKLINQSRHEKRIASEAKWWINGCGSVLGALLLLGAGLLLAQDECYRLVPCVFPQGKYMCMPMPLSVTTHTPVGEYDRLGYEPAHGTQCGILWWHSIPTFKPCGGPAIGGSCN